MAEHRDHGVVVSFDATKGFGFIRSPGRREDVFVHKSARVAGGPLEVGRRVSYLVEPSEKGPRALSVEVGARGLAPGQAAALGLLVALGAGMVGLHHVGLGWLGAWLVGLNIVAWLVYVWDKRQASHEGRRVPEAILLGLALLGGSPAAALSMRAYHHKTRKFAFLVPFVAIVALQIAALVGLWMRSA